MSVKRLNATVHATMKRMGIFPIKIILLSAGTVTLLLTTFSQILTPLPRQSPLSPSESGPAQTAQRPSLSPEGSRPQVQEFKLVQTVFPPSFNPDPLIVQKGIPVKIYVTTTQREHVNRISILPWVRSSDVLLPGKVTIVQFTPDRTGEFKIRNIGHDFAGTLIVQEKPRPTAWSQPVAVVKGLDVNQVQFTPAGNFLFPANGAIHRARPDGTNIKVLFSFQGVRRVAIRPDGKKILFDNDLDIFIADTDGRNRRPLANDPKVFEFASSFSPDGRKIVFVTIDNEKSTSGIWLMDADGSKKRSILLTKDFVLRHPRWSPDGKKISYFSVKKGKSTIWVMNSDGSQKRKLTSDSDSARQASWRNDSKRLVYVSRKSGHFDIWLMNPDGDGKVQLTNLAGDEVKPVWSPDDQKIAFICSGCSGRTSSDLYVISRK